MNPKTSNQVVTLGKVISQPIVPVVDKQDLDVMIILQGDKICWATRKAVR